MAPRPKVYAGGECGDSLKWILNDNTLKIIGKGKMNDYVQPWYEYRYLIEHISIDNGVTTIGKYAFYHCTSLVDVDIPDSIENIGEYAFYSCDSLKSIVISDNVTDIGAGAFKDCPYLSIVCRKGSYVDGYASDKKVKLIYK